MALSSLLPTASNYSQPRLKPLYYIAGGQIQHKRQYKSPGKGFGVQTGGENYAPSILATSWPGILKSRRNKGNAVWLLISLYRQVSREFKNKNHLSPTVRNGDGTDLVFSEGALINSPLLFDTPRLINFLNENSLCGAHSKTGSGPLGTKVNCLAN